MAIKIHDIFFYTGTIDEKKCDFTGNDLCARYFIY